MTGDLVNNRATEVEPHMPALAGRSNAPCSALRLMTTARRGLAEFLVVDDHDVALRHRVAAAHGIAVCLTRADHHTGTDRLAEAAAQLGFAPDAIVVNVQGDEPLLEPALIARMAALLASRDDASIAPMVSVSVRVSRNHTKLSGAFPPTPAAPSTSHRSHVSRSRA